MSDIITNLQNKSEQEKSLVAMVAAVFVTLILFGIWGYNFAHSGKISNLASGAAGVAEAVESANIGESFSEALEQIKSISSGIQTDAEKQEAQASQGSSVGNRYINIFATPESPEARQYGENAADVLY